MARDLCLNPTGATGLKKQEEVPDEIEHCFAFSFIDGSSRPIVLGCTSMTGQTVGQYVDDRTLTSRVKAKLVADKATNLTRVDVDTVNRVVSLNGIVESLKHKTRAEQLALQVSGVREVKKQFANPRIQVALCSQQYHKTNEHKAD